MLEKTTISTSFGVFEITGGESGIRSVSLVDRTVKAARTGSSVLLEAARQLKEYFDGNRQKFELPLDWSGAPEFHQKVWTELLKIPYGRTSSYLAIAEALGDVNAVRAVGQANRHNPIAIIVPCHRVIAKSGELQGYFYGLDMKMRLLQLENPKQFSVQGSLF